MKRNPKGPLRIPVVDKMRDNGLFINGKIESGTIAEGMDCYLMPQKKPFTLTHIYNTKDQRMKYATCGENVKVKVKGIDDEDV